MAPTLYDAARVNWAGRLLRGQGGKPLEAPVQFAGLYSRLAELAQ